MAMMGVDTPMVRHAAVVGVPLSGKGTFLKCAARHLQVQLEGMSEPFEGGGPFSAYPFRYLRIQLTAGPSRWFVDCLSGAMPEEGGLQLLARSSRGIFVIDAQREFFEQQREAWELYGPKLAPGAWSFLITKVDKRPVPEPAVLLKAYGISDTGAVMTFSDRLANAGEAAAAFVVEQLLGAA